MPTLQTSLRVSFNNILFPTDFSDASVAALPYCEGVRQSLRLQYLRDPCGYTASTGFSADGTDCVCDGRRVVRRRSKAQAFLG
jgi:hypothetical protein